MSDGGMFGAWEADGDGLPSFRLAGGLENSRGLVLPDGGADRMWHQVGNDRLTATAHAGGWTTLYSAEGGFVRLNYDDPSKPGGPGGMWEVVDESGRAIISPGRTPLDVTWGAGYAEWNATEGGLSLRRRTWAPFGDLPVLRTDVSVKGKPPDGSLFVESWSFRPHPLLFGPLMSRLERAPRSHTLFHRTVWYALFGATSITRAATDMVRDLLGAFMGLDPSFDSNSGAVILSPSRRGDETVARPSFLPGIPGVVFFAPLTGEPPVSFDRRGAVSSVRCEAPLHEDGTLSFAVGVCRRHEVAGAVEAAKECDAAASAGGWRGQFSLSLGSNEALEREATWSACQLRGAQVNDRHFSARYLPQGSAYGFVMGMQGAPRDYHGPSVPLTYIDPAGARDMLRLTMMMTRPDGVMYYSHTGSGACTSAIIHTCPTDLQLFFLWALAEHVFATGDPSFLEEEVPFHPGRAGRFSSSTVRERVVLGFEYTRDVVGCGEHGLLRSGSGDWSDPISFMVPDQRAFRSRGESGFNTAMAAYVLPLAASLIEAGNPAAASEMRDFAASLREAMEQSWAGSWYLRGWDGRGGPLGSGHLFLDANLWCLIAGIGSRERRDELVRSIEELCDSPSPIGATILDRPHRVRLGMLTSGWDCNGGVWAAINGLLAWAYSLHDPALAWRCLEKQTLASHARAYPRVWYGIWSGPDAYNAHYAEAPGETFIHPATPMRDFPVMNSHSHAGPLLALLKVLGIEAGPAGLEVHPRMPGSAGEWKLSTTLADFEWDGREGKVKRKMSMPPHRPLK
jgi:Glycosyl hydrolase 36 superfamily, catalytic domain